MSEGHGRGMLEAEQTGIEFSAYETLEYGRRGS